MAVKIKYQLDCLCDGCEGVASKGLTLDLSADDRPDGVLEIDVDMAVSQTEFECDTCGCTWFTGDLSDGMSRDVDECPGPPEDDEDDE
jgi:hypothetical protein